MDFVTVPNKTSVKFGMTFCPGKVQLDALTGSWFRDLKKDGKTIILATHDDKLIDLADRILNFDDGKIIEENLISN